MDNNNLQNHNIEATLALMQHRTTPLEPATPAARVAELAVRLARSEIQVRQALANLDWLRTKTEEAKLKAQNLIDQGAQLQQQVDRARAERDADATQPASMASQAPPEKSQPPTLKPGGGN